MTTTTSVKHAYIGMSVSEAASFIRRNWDALEAAKAAGQEHPVFTLSSKEELFRQRVRDCGWCIGHRFGTKGMHETHDLAIKGLRGIASDQLSRAIDYAFDGIDDWLA